MRDVDDRLALGVQAREQLEHLAAPWRCRGSPSARPPRSASGRRPAIARSPRAAARRRTARRGGGRPSPRAPRARGCAALARSARASSPSGRSRAAGPRSRARSASAGAGRTGRRCRRCAPRQTASSSSLIASSALPVDDDLAGGRPVDAGDQVEDRRLAAAGRADDRDELALVDRRGRSRAAPGTRAFPCGRPSRRRSAGSAVPAPVGDVPSGSASVDATGDLPSRLRGARRPPVERVRARAGATATCDPHSAARGSAASGIRARHRPASDVPNYRARYENIRSCRGAAPRSCTPTSTRSSRRSSSGTTRACAAGR